MTQKFNDGQELVFEDFNKLQQRLLQEMYDRVLFELVDRTEDAFFDDSFLVGFLSSTSITVNAGLGFQTDATVDASEPQKRALYRASSPTVNLTPPDASLDRIDIVCVKHARVDGPTESRKFKNASTLVITNENLVTTEDWEAEILVVAGTPDASPVAPATPAGYIKIAELDVTAVSGLAGAGAITDNRTQMPIGAIANLNTLGYNRLTAAASVPLSTLMAEIDGFLQNGSLDRNDFLDLVSDPTAPAANNLRLYNKGGVLFTRNNAGDVVPVGSGGGGGGGGANWLGDALEATEFGQQVWQFQQNAGQTLSLYIKIPQGYLPGRQITAYLGIYSPGATDNVQMRLTSSLIRKDVDAIDSVANQEINDSGDVLLDNANEFRELALDVTTAIGQINSFGVNPGDMVKLELQRIAPSGSENTQDIRFIPSSTEVVFG
jgi:hypothetical protein